MRKLLTSLFLVAALAAAAEAAPPPPAQHGAPAVGTDPNAKRITGSTNYVPTFGIRATVSHNYRVRGVLAVDAGLDIPDAEIREKAEALRPRLMSDLRDAVLNYATMSYRPGRRPDPDILRARMQKAADALLGKGNARVALASVIVFMN